MGQTLSEPVTEKATESGEDDRLFYGLSCMQGWRITMEDAHAAILDLNKFVNPEDEAAPKDKRLTFFAVYDGHGGEKVAQYSGANVHKIVARQTAFLEGDYEQALKDGFLATDRAILQDPQFKEEYSGCTATAALITNDKIYVANAGDSRTVLGVKGTAKPLSFDHKPANEGEKARITAAGGYVDYGRVNGNLALSRAIGDFEFKKKADLPPEQQIVTAYPDVIVHDITEDDEFLVLACDGIWDCFSSQKVIEFVRRGIVEKQDLTTICENLMSHCLADGNDTAGVGCDNMTVAILGLLHGQTKEQWYENIAKRVANGEGPVGDKSLAEIKITQRESRRNNDDEFDSGSGRLNPHILREIIMLGDGRIQMSEEGDDVEMGDADSDDEKTEIIEDNSKDEEAEKKTEEEKEVAKDVEKKEDKAAEAGSSMESKPAAAAAASSSTETKSDSEKGKPLDQPVAASA